jgi:hypothetical protein
MEKKVSAKTPVDVIVVTSLGYIGSYKSYTYKLD